MVIYLRVRLMTLGQVLASAGSVAVAGDGGLRTRRCRSCRHVPPWFVVDGCSLDYRVVSYHSIRRPLSTCCRLFYVGYHGIYNANGTRLNVFRCCGSLTMYFLFFTCFVRQKCCTLPPFGTAAQYRHRDVFVLDEIQLF